MKKIAILLALSLFASLINAQVKAPQPKVYQSATQKIIKGSLADATEEIVHNRVIIKVLQNKFDFNYPNHEHEDVSVTMTKAEWIEGAKEEDYSITSHPTVKEIYFMRDKNKIWVDFKNGDTIIYTITSVSKK